MAMLKTLSISPFKKTISARMLLILSALLLWVTAPAAPADVIVTPGDGYTGPYRLAFITAATRDATATDIEVYNTFVTTAANGVTELAALGATWKVIGSTDAVDVVDNTGVVSAGDVPVYTLDGVRISNDAAAMLNSGLGGVLLHAITEQTGDSPASNYEIWTGSNGFTLGGSSMGVVGYGEAQATDATWIARMGAGSAEVHPFMAMSSVVPEPATMSLLAISGIALIRKRRRA